MQLLIVVTKNMQSDIVPTWSAIRSSIFSRQSGQACALYRRDDDLSRRLEEHRQGMVHHTARYNISRLIYFESHEIAPDAIAREKQLKNWRREKKLILINRSNPEWRDLSGEID
jgi:putative endonuclease